MESQHNPHFVRDINGQIICSATLGFDPSCCKRCHMRFHHDDRFYCLGAPYHCLVHVECIAFFDYKQGWPHKHPFSSFASQPMGDKPPSP